MPIPKSSTQRVASVYRVAYTYRLARTVPMYTDEAMAILELPATASVEEAKKAFRRMMMIHHPDKGGDHEKALKILEAWNQLKDGMTIPRSRPSPSYSRPQPSSPPPRPTPQPTPRPQPSSTPPPAYGRWQKAEQKTGGNSRPDSKDRMRIEDMIKRSKGNTVKLLALATQMANSIDDIGKALRRGRAAEENESDLFDRMWTITYLNGQAANIFYRRAFALAGV